MFHEKPTNISFSATCLIKEYCSVCVKFIVIALIGFAINEIISSKNFVVENWRINFSLNEIEQRQFGRNKIHHRTKSIIFSFTRWFFFLVSLLPNQLSTKVKVHPTALFSYKIFSNLLPSLKCIYFTYITAFYTSFQFSLYIFPFHTYKHTFGK